MTADDQRRRLFPYLTNGAEGPAGRQPAGGASSSGACSSPPR